MYKNQKTHSSGSQGLFQLLLQEVNFELLPEKAIYLPDQKSLLIADPHFGKAAHFRKAGVPVPESVHHGDYVKIKKLIQNFQPLHLFFLGDLFHSDFNQTWLDLEAFPGLFPGIQFHLIKGNHDILPAQFYRSELWDVHSQSLVLGNLLLSHEPEMDIPEGMLNICGHVHPGISLYGQGRQKLTLPCFFVSPKRIILPAFGRFTGLAKLECEKHDRAFVIANKKIVEVNLST
ncbi:ligase-associated DNA damage response endonuclease PdeM [Cecembia sp.]|uniref:ligase-associated DNA damage response endonuclease PdeM n=1 Tax=Cecembia sp. TaxID=1898110 RepID=UPI0025C48E4C|nr:ligase-associated DNA damage response endonuclease PdeM [Cecembia sp.]